MAPPGHGVDDELVAAGDECQYPLVCGRLLFA